MSPSTGTLSGTSMAGAVVALKPSATAKSRLTDVVVPLRQRLAQAMALDTLTALTAAQLDITVVTDDPALPRILSAAEIRADIVPEPTPAGMNRALAAGAAHLLQTGHDPVLACVGDLPALTADSVRTVLAAVGDQERAFLSDADSVGTTMLIAAGTTLDPHFGGGSAAAHGLSGARVITDDELGGPIPAARTDVDDLGALAAALRIGVGVHTAQLIDPDTGTVADYQPITVAAGEHEHRYPVITDSGVRMDLPSEVLDPRIRLLRPGQRLHAVRGHDRLLSAWL